MSPIPRRLFIVFLVLSAGICARLGFWQLGRLEDRRAANRRAAEARAAPVVRLPEGPGGAGTLANRRVKASGRYDPANEIVVRGASYQGVPGVTVVTPLRLAGTDTVLLVTRGFVPSPDAVTVELDTLIEPGEVRVAGVALPVDSGAGRPLVRNERTTWGALDLAALRARLPYPIYPVVLRQAPDPALPRLPRRLEAPPLDDGPHLSYAVQWFLFATMALVFAAVVVGRWRS
ncbi:MAG TPA: SURF1 family protein [Gemmatimonadales bacterium]|nr:SURF1 family protein [Gemmatimonadales bacterium]